MVKHVTDDEMGRAGISEHLRELVAACNRASGFISIDVWHTCRGSKLGSLLIIAQMQRMPRCELKDRKVKKVHLVYEE